MADDKNFETNMKDTASKSGSRKRGASQANVQTSSARANSDSGELDLASAESQASGEGFNHPHAASELNTTADVEKLAVSANSKVDTLQSAASRIAGIAGSLSKEDLMNNFNDIKGYAKEYSGKAREAAETVRRQAGEFAKRFEDVPAKGREVFERVDSTTRANPWLSIAVTGAGALALGFLAGKLFARASEAVGEAGYDFDQAMDE